MFSRSIRVTGIFALTAKLPGAFRAIVQPHPRYSEPSPSSESNLKKLRPRTASGFVCILILSTSRGNKTCQGISLYEGMYRARRQTTSPIPVKLRTHFFQHTAEDCTQDSRPRCGMHHQTAGFRAKRRPEPIASVLVELIAEIGLSTELVYSLGDFVARGIAQTGEQGHEFPADARIGGRAEDDGVDL